MSIAFTVYNSTALFPVRNTSQDMTVSSTVVGSQVVSVQVSGIADGTTLTNPVTFQLRLTNLPELLERMRLLLVGVFSGTLKHQVSLYCLVHC